MKEPRAFTGTRNNGKRKKKKKKNHCDLVKRESHVSPTFPISLRSFLSLSLYRSISQEPLERSESKQHFCSATPATEQCAAICHAFQSVLDVPLIGIQMDINISRVRPVPARCGSIEGSNTSRCEPRSARKLYSPRRSSRTFSKFQIGFCLWGCVRSSLYFVDFESCSGVKLHRLWVTCAAWRQEYLRFGGSTRSRFCINTQAPRSVRIYILRIYYM